MIYSPLNNINIEILGTLIHNIEQDPVYFIPLIFPKETKLSQQHLISKFKKYNRIELFAPMLDIEHSSQLNIYLTVRYNEIIKKFAETKKNYTF